MKRAKLESNENIDRVRNMLMAGKRVIINKIANDISISCKRVKNVLDNEVGMTMVSVRWMWHPTNRNHSHLIKNAPG